MQPVFDGVTYYQHSEKENVSEELFRNGICLPSGTNMTEDDQIRTIHFIKKAIEQRV